jgi:gamma-glutamyltranspeptidase / glutathione hydrolase
VAIASLPRQNARMRTKPILLALLLLALPAQAASPPPVAAEHGMVVSAHRLASEVGVEVLKRGGNAVDAAVAVGYALAVVFPSAGNLGGGGFMTVQLADGRKTFIDCRESAPAAASKTMYLDAAGEVVKGRSTDGWLAAGVPGTVAGLEFARERYGTQPRETLIAPAVGFAEDGFLLDAGDAAILARSAAALARNPAAAAIFLRDGKPLAAGQKLVQRDLAWSLRQVLQSGTTGFYRGPVAQRIVDGSRLGGGIFAEPDFANYRVRELVPVECDFRGYRIVSSPPPSSGGVIICELLNILEAFPHTETEFRSARATHRMIEAMRHAYLDRNSYLGDPDYVRNPLDRLLDDAYAAKIRAVIDDTRAGSSPALKPGTAPHESTETTHYSIVDAAGNAVAVTYTLNGSFGAKVVAPGTGILMNNEMDDFTVKPGVPNLYGLVQGEANAVEPGKRPLSSMSPTIVSRDGKVLMVIGSPGGPRIITIVLQAILNVLEHGMTIQEAIDAPRLHHQWLPETVFVERYALSPDTRKILADMGHKLTDQGFWGHATGILVGAPALGAQAVGKNRLYGANDSRAVTGAAVGY